MTGRVVSAAIAAAAAILALLAVLAIVPKQRDLAIQAYAVVLGGLVLLWLLASARAQHPEHSSGFDRAMRVRASRVERLPQLARVEREVELGVANAFDLHYRLRPLLRAIAAHRLALRRGIDLELEPEAARATLPPSLWDVVRPDRQPPTERHGRGLGRDELRAAVEALDRI